jgi:mannose-6-phosphate isomerase-like protein (cupin superfamily)
MNDILSMFQKIKVDQKRIDTLLAEHLVGIKNGEKELTWSIEEYYQGKECNFGFAHADTDGRTDFPFHTHGPSLEYLICVSGSLNLTFKENSAVRFMKPGDCASIPPNVMHSTQALEPGTKLFYICIPSDESFPPFQGKE